MINEMIAFLNLSANKPAGVKSISHAWTEEPLETVRDRLPAVWIYQGGDEAEDSGYDFATGHWVTQNAHVSILCALEDLETIRSAVRAKLLGWSESAHHTSLRMRGGDVMGIKGSTVWWQDTYYNEYQTSAAT